MPKAERILETCLYASDLAAAEKFYAEVLGLPLLAKMEGRHVFFRLDQSVFLVFNPDETERHLEAPFGVVPTHGAHGRGHA